ncbi:hypothetical protein [Leptolyngbya sp. PCC 6406]|uniref:hypothetical protein n=1 Tax=Leptolyngbya sp. PCC 6406 TaxID=1173264 RepID=UPI0002ACBF8B|nr:hypothetical protein [Leptolyngbya sp. PCC 6406]
MAIRILLQTTLLATETDDWTIRHFSLLRDYLTGLVGADGSPLCEVMARDREPDAQGNDPVLSRLNRGEFDELWLFALDVGDGLSEADSAGITRFHRQGGGILTTRDHQDMGLSMAALPTLGKFHFFHSQQPDPDPDRCCRDDPYTLTIDWPNYHSGANGDYQTITPVDPLYPLLKRADGVIDRFPAHPHEGSVGVPEDLPGARVVALGTSKVTGRSFTLVVACDYGPATEAEFLGRVVAQSTFHHFVDYNLEVSRGCPSFVDEPPGNGVKADPTGLVGVYAYFQNLALWLAPAA